jgi:hypothetical protein
MSHPVERIISGGQTGADQGGLAAGVTLGLQTGGWAPKGWQTEKGAEMRLLRGLGLREYQTAGYAPRTKANIRDSQGTLLIGNPSSPGSRLTEKAARRRGRPIYVLVTEPSRDLSQHVEPLRKWLLLHDVRTLNVAGNRESVAPGLAQTTHDFLVAVLE